MIKFHITIHGPLDDVVLLVLLLLRQSQMIVRCCVSALYIQQRITGLRLIFLQLRAALFQGRQRLRLNVEHVLHGSRVLLLVRLGIVAAHLTSDRIPTRELLLHQNSLRRFVSVRGNKLDRTRGEMLFRVHGVPAIVPPLILVYLLIDSCLWHAKYTHAVVREKLLFMDRECVERRQSLC